MRRGRILLCSSHDFIDLHGTPQQISSRLSETFDIYYIENPSLGTLFPNVFMSSWTTPIQTFLRLLRILISFTLCIPHKERNGIKIYKPIGLPKYYSHIPSSIVTKAMLSFFVKKLLKTMQPDICVVIDPSYVCVAPLLRVRGIKVVYISLDYCAADQPLEAKDEIELLEYVDQIIAVSHGLKRLFEQRCKQVRYIPNGVSFKEFSNCSIPPKGILYSQPIICFIGAFGNHVDFDLTLDVARRRPDWTFLLVGSGKWFKKVKVTAPRNCIVTGGVAFSDVKHYIAVSDVCIIPFKRTVLTDYACPIKLFEYLGCGKAVVSTPIREVKDIAEQVVAFGSNAEEFIEAIEQCLEAPPDAEKLKAFASKFDWDAISDSYKTLFNELISGNMEVKSSTNAYA